MDQGTFNAIATGILVLVAVGAGVAFGCLLDMLHEDDTQGES